MIYLLLCKAERSSPPMPRTKADLGGALEDPRVGSSVHLVAPWKSQMRFEVTLYTMQQAEMHPEQVHPAGHLYLRAILQHVQDPVHGTDEAVDWNGWWADRWQRER